jgi:hypothetical protein
MKNAATVAPAIVFPDPAGAPTAEELNSVLGQARTIIETLEDSVHRTAPAAEWEWQYSKRSGWYRLLVVRQRRLFYFVPKPEGFRISLVLGGRAMKWLHDGPYAQEFLALAATAVRYPEGTAFAFDEESDPQLIAEFVAAKLAY